MGGDPSPTQMGGTPAPSGETPTQLGGGPRCPPCTRNHRTEPAGPSPALQPLAYPTARPPHPITVSPPPYLGGRLHGGGGGDVEPPLAEAQHGLVAPLPRLDDVGVDLLRGGAHRVSAAAKGGAHNYGGVGWGPPAPCGPAWGARICGTGGWSRGCRGTAARGRRPSSPRSRRGAWGGGKK